MIPAFDEVRERITARRNQIGLTQQELADTADVSQSFIAKLEQGRNTPNYAAVARVYNTLEKMETDDEQTAGELMSSYVVSVRSDDTVDHATSIMKTRDYSQLPVIDDNRCVGSVTLKTLLDLEPGEEIGDHVESAFPEVQESAGKDAVAELLQTADAVLVRRNNSIRGIITATDLI